MGGTHNESWQKGGEKYFLEFKEFIKKCNDYNINILEDDINFINKLSINEEEDISLIEKKND